MCSNRDLYKNEKSIPENKGSWLLVFKFWFFIEGKDFIKNNRSRDITFEETYLNYVNLIFIV